MRAAPNQVDPFPQWFGGSSKAMNALVVALWQPDHLNAHSPMPPAAELWAKVGDGMKG
jgi:hypothetical protein